MFWDAENAWKLLSWLNCVLSKCFFWCEYTPFQDISMVINGDNVLVVRVEDAMCTILAQGEKRRRIQGQVTEEDSEVHCEM